MLGPDFAHWRLPEFNLMESQNKHAAADLAFVVENNTAILLVYRKPMVYVWTDMPVKSCANGSGFRLWNSANLQSWIKGFAAALYLESADAT